MPSRLTWSWARSARAHSAVESRAVVAGTGREVVVDVDGVDVTSRLSSDQ